MQSSVSSKYDRDTTAEDVVSGVNLRGRLAVITGGSTGLGKETARVLAGAGADVFIGARSESKLEQARVDLIEAGARNVIVFPLDLMESDSVSRFAECVLKLGRPIDLLINNAGIMAGPLVRNSLGIEAQFATNYVGHALLTSLLAPALTRAKNARLISLSSVGHHITPVVMEDLNYQARHYEPFDAYGQSKTANVLLAVKVAKHLSIKGVTALAVHPGMIHTELARDVSRETMKQAQIALSVVDLPDYKTVEAGAATTVWAATATDLAGKGPLYLEDCQVAPLVQQSNSVYGVLPYALDADVADQLWARAEEMLGRSLPL